ncbi:MAG TPA: hypothetical protein VLI05_05450 [Candidatus Saccharimonadia bacterium]|nr:hypothetical protein [Candidatus Saccharimonadia bacterium]
MQQRGLPTRLWRGLAGIAAVVLALAPVTASAAGLSARSDLMGTSQAGVATTHIVAATTATTANIGSIGFQFCTTATSGCTTPTGLVTTGAGLAAQSGATGFTMVNTTNGAPYITRSAINLPAATALSYTLSGITNPTTANQSFYVRITTYTGSDGATGPTDTGTVAVSTAQPVQLTGVTPEILIFCVGTSITGDCTTVSGSTVDFGDFDPLATKTGTSMMQATTNAGNGYSITVNGTTLASGANTIPALTSQTASNVGTSQFGLNLRANATPAVGADPTGAGSGSYTANYGTANQYRFNTGDAVASAAAPTNANTFTSSYIVNIGGAQAAGVYTATMTYICTAAF